MSEDVMAAIKAIKKLGIKVKINKKMNVKFMEKELMDINIKKILTINAKNSGTLRKTYSWFIN